MPWLPPEVNGLFPGRGPPGRGMPVLPDVKGLFPGRGPPGRGAGRVPGWAVLSATWSVGAAAAGRCGAGAGELVWVVPGAAGPRSAGAPLNGEGDAGDGAATGPGRRSVGPEGAVATGSGGVDAVLAAGRGPDLAAALEGAALDGAAGMASRSLRTTGASTVDDADRTNSPSSLSLVRTTLLSTPSSFASS